jgi:serine/threonine-protein kinase
VIATNGGKGFLALRRALLNLRVVNTTSLRNSLIGEYRLVDFLGEGGMGEVYRAVHVHVGRAVAVKVLKNPGDSPRFVERFRNEARIHAQLQHPHIATLYEFLEFRGRPCIVMEYVDGQTLSDRIRRQGRLSPSETAAIFQAVVEAIHYVHSHDIIHRDIKSSNVKINSEGQVKLLDFGIAKSQSTPNLTVTGSVVGTLQYLSPEQLKGERADARSDIWALGVLLYEMVTAQLPFEASSIGELYEKISKAAYTLPSVMNPAVSRDVEAVIVRCLKKNPSDRYPSAQALLRDIARLTKSENGERKGETSFRPHRLWLIIAAVAVLLLVAVGFFKRKPPLKDETVALPPSEQRSMPRVEKQSSPQPTISESNGTMQTVTIDAAGGQAEVYRDGVRVGTTPYQLQARVGEHVVLTLKREGYDDKVVEFDVTEGRKEYIDHLEKRE